MDFLMMGELKKKEGLLGRTWTPRWAVLNGQGELIFYNNNSSTRHPFLFLTELLQGEQKLITIKLSEETVVVPSVNVAEENCFTIQDPHTGKSLELLANTPADMAGWINALVMATVLRSEPQDMSQRHENQNQNSVFSVKGLMCEEHIEKIKSIIKETVGIENFEFDPVTEYLYISGIFDSLIVKDSIEKIGFLVYDEPDVPPKCFS